MYQFLDRRLDELDATAAFLVQAMRMWVTCIQHRRCPCHMTASHFAAAGVGGIADDFGMAMFTLNGDGLQPLHLAPPGCLSVRDDEARLLALFDEGARGDGPALEQVAATLVDPTAISRLVQAASIVSRHLAVAHVSPRFAPRFD